MLRVIHDNKNKKKSCQSNSGPEKGKSKTEHFLFVKVFFVHFQIFKDFFLDPSISEYTT